MNSSDDSKSMVQPWKDQELLTEKDAIKRLNKAVKKAVDAGAKEAARLAVIGAGNYVKLTQGDDWSKFMDRANELLAELEGTQTRRWG